MTRLTKTIRDRMAKILLKHRFMEQGEELAQRSVELFHLVYADKYPAETRKNMASIQNRHKTAFGNAKTLQINVAGMTINIGNRQIGKDGVLFDAIVNTPRPVFNNWSKYEYLDCEIAEQLKTFAAADYKFCKDIAQARIEVMVVLDSFSTERALREGWPEAVPLIGHVLSESIPGTNLPAVQIERLNKEFGIPPVSAEAQ
jgi:hypothetical protein